MTILILAAHPDDEVLGCGGTIPNLKKQGEEVHIVILGQGITSREKNASADASKKIKSLQSNATSAAKIMGADSIQFHSFPDNRFDSVPMLDIIKTIEDHILHFKPHTIFTHHPGDLNIDHTITGRATLTAARPVPGQGVKNIYAYEVLSSTEWTFSCVSPPFEPNLFMDIQDNISIKVEAMKAYTSEIRKFPHPRSSDAIITLAKQRGSMAGLPYCEAFSIIRAIKGITNEKK